MSKYPERKPNLSPTLAQLAAARDVLDGLSALNSDDPGGWGVRYKQDADNINNHCLAYCIAAEQSERAGIPLN